MNSKIFTIFILIITFFSFFTFTFATEEPDTPTEPEEIKTITLISPNSNSYTFTLYDGEFDGYCYLFYSSSNNELRLYFFDKDTIFTILDDTNKRYQFTTVDGSDGGTLRLYTCAYNEELGCFTNWTRSYGKQPTFTGNTLTHMSSNTYEYIGYFNNTDPLKTLPVEPEEPDTPTEPDDPNGEIVIDPTEINNNLSKIYTGIQFIVSFLSLGAVVLLIYIVYKLFSIFFPF